jgi:hypothetical protein
VAGARFWGVVWLEVAGWWFGLLGLGIFAGCVTAVGRCVGWGTGSSRAGLWRLGLAEACPLALLVFGVIAVGIVCPTVCCAFYAVNAPVARNFPMLVHIQSTAAVENLHGLSCVGFICMQR